MDEPLRDALALQRRAAAQGFDWQELAGLWIKLEEEIAELRGADDAASRADELGDLLFMAVNLARHLGVDPTLALHGANRKFTRRFDYIMERVAELPPPGDARRLAAMEALWCEAKVRERHRG